MILWWISMSDVRIGEVGEILRMAREDAGLSLQNVADRLGCNRATVSKYESNKIAVSLDIVESIADAVGCPKDQLVLQCLQQRYSTSKHRNSPIGKLFGQLLKNIG